MVVSWKQMGSVLLSGIVAVALTTTAVAQEPQRDQQDQPNRPQQNQQDQPGTPQADRPQTDQDRNQPGQVQERQTGQQMQVSELDKYLATWLIAKNKCEVELSQLAQQHAQHEEVKQFASRMAEDHQKLISDLQQFAGAEGDSQEHRVLRVETGEERIEARERDRQEATTDRPGTEIKAGTETHMTAGGDAAKQLIAVIKQVENEKSNSLKKGLEQKEGEQFDQSFMWIQVLGHVAMLDTLKVMKSEAKGELQQTIEQAEQSVEQHLKEAQRIEKQVRQQSSQQQDNR